MADRCRSCKAPIRWAVTINGRAIPLDLLPDQRGNLRLDPPAPGATPPTARVVASQDRADWVGRLYLPHFVNCPYSSQYRRPR